MSTDQVNLNLLFETKPESFQSSGNRHSEIWVATREPVMDSLNPGDPRTLPVVQTSLLSSGPPHLRLLLILTGMCHQRPRRRTSRLNPHLPVGVGRMGYGDLSTQCHVWWPVCFWDGWLLLDSRGWAFCRLRPHSMVFYLPSPQPGAG